MATVREIASLAGVSPSTVSRVINGNVPVKESARNKVLRAIQRLDEQGGRTEPRLRGEVGIVMPVSSAMNLAEHPSLYSTVLSFIETVSAHELGNTTILLDEHSQPQDLRTQSVCGYLVLGTSEEQEGRLLEMLTSFGKPFIFINRLMDNKLASCINIDDEQATEQAVNYLLSLGHRRIAFRTTPIPSCAIPDMSRRCVQRESNRMQPLRSTGNITSAPVKSWARSCLSPESYRRRHASRPTRSP